MNAENDLDVELIRSILRDHWPQKTAALTSGVFNRLTSDIASARPLSIHKGKGGYDHELPSFEEVVEFAGFVKCLLEIIKLLKDIFKRPPTADEVNSVLSAGGKANQVIEDVIKRTDDKKTHD